MSGWEGDGGTVRRWWDGTEWAVIRATGPGWEGQPGSRATWECELRNARMLVHGHIEFEGGSREAMRNNEMIRRLYLGM